MQNVDKNTFLNIDLKALVKNYNLIKGKVNKHCIIGATVKADAYGLGSNKIVSALVKENCNNFFVATTNEGLELRKINKNISIFLLNGLVTKELDLIKKNKLIPVINNIKQLKIIEKFQIRKKIKLNIALHFDTGMSRLGFDSNETEYLLKNKSQIIKSSKIALVMSHLACADDKKSKKNKIQLERFMKIKKYFPNTLFSLSNSAGILLGKKYHFDMVRPGISLYGGHCRINEKNIYENVVTLSAKLIQVREIYKNDTIGYGATFKANAKMKIGTLPFGYADGFNRLFSNNSCLFYKNKKIEIVGRISMDLVTVNLTKFAKYRNIENDEIQIISKKYSINDISKIINTIPYEILTNLGKRYQRRYIA